MTVARAALPASFCVLVLLACDAGEPLCVPGASVACVGPGGCAGFQVCTADGRGLGDCDCAGLDAGSADAGSADAGSADAGAVDAGTDGGGTPADLDGGASDAAFDEDAGAPDAGATDAGDRDSSTPDAGPPVCEPACDATTRCCGSTCVSRVGVARGLEGRDDPSFQHCNACGATCDPSTASACSVLAGEVMPRCACGVSAACTGVETCALIGGSFACVCGATVCSASRDCYLVEGTPTCIDLSTDPMHCGALGRACPAPTTCRSGRCLCPGATAASRDCGGPDTACCGSTCTDVSTTTNCGACGVRCRVGETCAAGTCRCATDGTRCVPPSSGVLGESCCGGSCVANSDVSCECEPCADGAYCRHNPFMSSDLYCAPR